MSYTQKRCSFCYRLISLGTGVMYIRNDAATFWYCSSKCRKNATVLKRDSRKLKWARQISKGAKRSQKPADGPLPSKGKA
ncbi:MAG: 50S ribosomal protein L24e [Nitrososphaerales archaeon]